ncbi:MAG: PAS domain-containing protein [Methanosarcinaceae archaeon]|nr:PAS domain-containing protein [Methanosarcinaceae archaeon]
MDNLKKEYVMSPSKYPNPELSEKEKLPLSSSNFTQIQISEERYRLFAEKAGKILFDADLKTGAVEWLGAIKDVTGYEVSEFHKIGLEGFKKLIHPEDQNRLSVLIDSVLEGECELETEYRFRKKDGKYIYLEITVVFLKDEEGKPYRVLGVLKDITEKVHSRRKMEKNAEKFLYVAEQTGQLIFDIDFRTNKIEWAGAIEKITGCTPEEFYAFNLFACRDSIHPDDRGNVWKTLKHSLKTGDNLYAEFRFRKTDGNYVYVEDSAVFLRDEAGRVYRALGVIKDISEKKHVRETLERNEGRLRTYMKNLKGIGFQLDRNFKPVMMLGAVEDILGYTPEDILSGKIILFDLFDPGDRDRLIENQIKLLENPELVIDHIYRIRRRDGSLRWVHEIIQSIRNVEGETWLFQGSVRDITDKKRAEETLKLAEEIHKKEIHHRIKNNLQVISSLLDLQADFFEDKEVIRAFRESQNRVISMALIHEELYKSRDLESLDFAGYLRKLTGELFRSYALDSSKIRLHMDAATHIFLRMDTAIPLGMIVNELVSNSLKHAFFEGNNGEIRIKLQCMEYKTEYDECGCPESFEYVLSVSDNGRGIPKNIDFENPETLGLQLVNILVKQIGGEIELKRNSGAEFVIRFGKQEPSTL